MLNSQEIELIENVINKYRDSIIEIIDKDVSGKKIYESIDNSLLVNTYKDIYYYKLLKIKNVSIDTRLLIIKVTTTVPTTKKLVRISETQLIGMKKLDMDFGHILIRPETFEDKINEIFTKTEIDFKDFPKFSSKYYYLLEDLTLGNMFASNNRLALIEKQKDIVIEVKDEFIIAKYPRVFNDLDFGCLLDFMKKI